MISKILMTVPVWLWIIIGILSLIIFGALGIGLVVWIKENAIWILLLVIAVVFIKKVRLTKK